MTAPNFERSLHEKAPFLQWVRVVFTSVVTGQRVFKVLDLIQEVDEQRNRRIATHDVNEVLQSLVTRTRPPSPAGHPIKIRYATQVAVAPPTFLIWSNRPDAIPESYQRYLHNGFRQHWGFQGVPLRIRYRQRGEQE